MPSAGILTALQTRCLQMSGVQTCTIGWPLNEVIPEAGCPWIILDSGQPKWTPITYVAGGAGSLRLDYYVMITVILGPANMAPSDAQSAGNVWADRLRGVLSVDITLGGLIFYGELYDSSDNTETYHKVGQEAQPQATYRYAIQEIIARNAAVAP